MWQDIASYFLSPETAGYTASKTLVYALVLALAVYIVFEVLKKLKIKIDKRLAIGIAPFVVFGGIARVLEDADIVSSYWFVTPGIYMSVFILTFSSLLISLLIEKKKKIPYYKILFCIGTLFAVASLFYIKLVNYYYGAFLVLLFLLPWALLFWFVKKWSLTNRLITLTQMFDATTTYVALNYFGYYEQHVIPTYFISLFGPISFIFLKFVVVVSILVLIDKFSDNKQFSNWLKLCIAILGGATGTRDLIRLAALV